MLTSRLLFTLLALAIAPVLSAPVPATSLVRRGEDSVDIVARAPLPEPASRKSSQRAPAASKSKSKSTKPKAGGKKKHKHVKSPNWLYRRTMANAEDTITIGSVSAKLKAVPGLNNQGRTCAVFQVDWNGVKAFAKQSVSEQKSKFDEEIAKTKLVKNPKGGNLYITDGMFNGHHWLITKAMDGKTFARLKVEGKLDALGEEQAVEKAVAAVVGAQELLAKDAKAIQNDMNQGNWLFSDDLEHVNIIDMGDPAPLPVWSTFVANRQKSLWTGTFKTAWTDAAGAAERSRSH